MKCWKCEKDFKKSLLTKINEPTTLTADNEGPETLEFPHMQVWICQKCIKILK
ncbi:MAG: hypothetical protein KJ697_04075 [Nanoarchaeota archaeon]|nr:hypothetical protein [Nanoarchaeota archaeon]MBU4123907.1 hypothetical protein [Nanoarchaeota archaeon]